ncbi:DUF6343 family protein [Longimycelium tulufanense]|nr:DUF6343 family protein [Longimycelium tulufanense]
MARDRRRRPTREEYQRGLYGYHDPTAGFGGAPPALSALTLRLWLAGIGVVVWTLAAIFAYTLGIRWLAVIMAVLAVVGIVDFAWVSHRKRRGEPG